MNFYSNLFRLPPEDRTPAQLVLAKACLRENRGKERESSEKTLKLTHDQYVYFFNVLVKTCQILTISSLRDIS
ncbi:MAG: hypothetical protein OXJ52_10135 [Oligoflexia bacterium]|nr:hypothetical protein [Oligoflexia bacterium]